MGEICYAIPPDDFRSVEKPNGIWKVRKALYGSPQAGRRWDSTQSFPPSFADDVREEQHGNLVRRLQEEKFRLTDMGDVEVFCGMQFERHSLNLLTRSIGYQITCVKAVTQLMSKYGFLFDVLIEVLTHISTSHTEVRFESG
eukprot:g75246.t1